MKKIVVGAVEITRVEESLAPSFEPAFLFPEWRPEYLEQYGWMEPHFYDRGAGKFMSSIHSWVIRTKHHLIEIGRHTSELQSLMRISKAVFCLKKKHV